MVGRVLYARRVPRTNPMPPEEAAVCARLAKFRKSKFLTRAAFARFVGMDARLLGSYELARSQLNYPSAFQILSRFPLLNPEWLAGDNQFMMELEQNITYPSPAELEYGPRASFIDVYRVFLRDKILASRSAWLPDSSAPFPVFRFTLDIAGRLRAEEIFRVWLRRWLAWLPDEQLNDYLNELKLKAEALLEKNRAALHKREDVRRRVNEVEKLWIEMQTAFLRGRGSGTTPGIILTEAETSSKDVPVKAQLPSLLERLRKATAATGKKTELAEFLRRVTRANVPLASVSRWLSGEREPGGEIALQLDEWATRQGFPKEK